jgi:hypothetical protein
MQQITATARSEMDDDDSIQSPRRAMCNQILGVLLASTAVDSYNSTMASDDGLNVNYMLTVIIIRDRLTLSIRPQDLFDSIFAFLRVDGNKQTKRLP